MMRDLSVEALRKAVRSGDGPARVEAAFALGRLLGSASTAELDLAREPSSGVRMHWLTVLASHGEREAVRAIAERAQGTPEGDHALHLAVQLGESEGTWLALRFAAASERCQTALMKANAPVAWDEAVLSLDRLRTSDRPEVRGLAKSLLRRVRGVSDALKGEALARPEEAAEILEYWARGPDHHELVDAMLTHTSPLPLLQALQAAGRKYTLERLAPCFERSVKPPEFARLPEAIALAYTKRRHEVLALLDGMVTEENWLSPEWETMVAEDLPAPFLESERAVARRLARAAMVQAWEVAPPCVVPLLVAHGSHVRKVEEGDIFDYTAAFFDDNERARALGDLLRTMGLPGLDGVEFLEESPAGVLGFVWDVASQQVWSVQVSWEDEVAVVLVGAGGQLWPRDELERAWRRGQFPTQPARWELVWSWSAAVMVEIA